LPPRSDEEGALAHSDPTRQGVDAVRLDKMRVQKIKQLAETLAFPQLRHRAAQLLWL
jgi:hypothetical protein